MSPVSASAELGVVGAGRGAASAGSQPARAALRPIRPRRPASRTGRWAGAIARCSNLHASWFGAAARRVDLMPALRREGGVRTRLRETRRRSQPDRNRGPVIVGAQTFRLPTSRDLAPGRGRRAESSAVRSGWSAAASADPRRSAGRTMCWRRSSEQLATADPMAETRLALGCPSVRSRVGRVPRDRRASSGQRWRRAPGGCCGRSTRWRSRTAGANPRSLR